MARSISPVLKEEKEVAEKLSETIYRLGPPDEIISDCGGEFNS